MEKYWAQIQDYIDGLLTAEEKQAFEQELAGNRELQEELALQQRLNAVIGKQLSSEENSQALKNTLQQLNKDYFTRKQPAKVVSFKKTWIALAAAACIAIAIVTSGIFSSTNYEALPQMTTTITRGSNTDSLYNEAVTAYTKKEYLLAINALNQLAMTDSANAAVHYYLGLSLIGEKTYPRAASVLETVANGPSVYKEDAAYFAGLAYYKTGDTKKAALYLQQVPAGSSYYKKAQKLLGKVK